MTSRNLPPMWPRTANLRIVIASRLFLSVCFAVIYPATLMHAQDRQSDATGVTATSVREDKPLRVITLGDSITKGVRTGVLADETFSAILESRLRSSQIAATVINTGIGGERTDQALKRLDTDVLALKPDIVLVMYGTNDSYVDQGATDSRISADEFEANLRLISSKLKEHGVTVILMTEPAWGKQAGTNGVGEHPNLRLETYMTRTRKVAEDSRIPLVDHYELWTSKLPEGTSAGDLTTDQCHPNPRGHQFMAEQILPILKSQAESRIEQPKNCIPHDSIP